ncbi:MAG: response regulator transcription factor [Chryseolinea sp.]
MMTTKIRIALADDHTLIREGFKSLLGKNENFTLVGEADNGKDLIALVDEFLPDIVLLDISMPQMNGLQAMEQISKQHPFIKLIILTMHEEREYILQALKSGASGYLLKNIERFELERAIATVYEGGKYFSPAITNILAEAAIRQDPGETPELTPREKEVLNLVAKGNSTKQIADILKISIRTVESHRMNMLKRLKVNNTAELVKKSVELKLLD